VGRARDRKIEGWREKEKGEEEGEGREKRGSDMALSKVES